VEHPIGLACGQEIDASLRGLAHARHVVDVAVIAAERPAVEDAAQLLEARGAGQAIERAMLADVRLRARMLRAPQTDADIAWRIGALRAAPAPANRVAAHRVVAGRVTGYLPWMVPVQRITAAAGVVSANTSGSAIRMVCMCCED
jgi:hypothetical protein